MTETQRCASRMWRLVSICCLLSLPLPMRRSVLAFMTVLMFAGCGDDGAGGSVDAAPAVVDAASSIDSAVSASCDPIAQDCTAGDTPKCAVTFQPTGPECVEELGMDELDAPCTRPTNTAGIDTCEQGLYCANFGVDTGRVCRDMCTAAAGCQDSSRLCFNMLDSGFGACVPACAPLVAPSTCPAQQNCHVYPPDLGGSNEGYCEPSGTLAQGQTCTDNRECDTGLGCISVLLGGPSTCEVVCDPTNNTQCDMNVTCLPFTNAPGYGFCDPAG